MIRNKSIATPTLADTVIIGIDPGLARTGIGVIAVSVSGTICLESTVIRTKSQTPLADRLASIYTAIMTACTKYHPSLAGIERTFVNDNPASSLALGQARGAAIAALGTSKIEMREIAPNAVKKQVTGNALASKSDVNKMVKQILGISKSTKLAADATDALAIALSCTRKQQSFTLRRRRSYRRRR